MEMALLVYVVILNANTFLSSKCLTAFMSCRHIRLAKQKLSRTKSAKISPPPPLNQFKGEIAHFVQSNMIFQPTNFGHSTCRPYGLNLPFNFRRRLFTWAGFSSIYSNFWLKNNNNKRENISFIP